MNADSLWTLWLANSADMSYIHFLSEASAINLELTLNRPGRLTFSFPLSNIKSVDFVPVNKCVVLMYRDEIVWSGPIWSLSESVSDEKINIITVGWLELLHHRITREKIIYLDTTRGQIIQNLLTVANSQQDTWLPNGVNADDAPVISKTFERFSNIGDGIQEMTSIEAGPDVFVNPASRQLDVRAWDNYVDRPNVIWAYGTPEENIQSFTRTIDVDSMVNRLNVLGKNDNTVPFLAEDITSQDDYRLFEQEETLSSVSDDTILTAYGQAEIVYKGTPRVTYSFDPLSGDSLPLIFRDFQIGDKCRLRAKFSPRIDVEQNIRVFACNLLIDENGNPKLSNVTTVAS